MAANDSTVETEGSAFGRMFNVLAAPSEVFTEIKERPVRHANWLLPAFVSMVVGISVVLILFSQESIMHDLLAMQSKAMDQQVAKGKIPREAADQFEKNSKTWMPMAMKIGGAVGVFVYAFGVPFFWGFFIWLFGTKVFKADFEFMKGVEMAGLATIIYTLAGLVGGLVSLSMNKLMTLTPAAFLTDFDLTDKGHLALAALNPFYFWYLCVVAVSITVLAEVSWKKPAALLLGVWVLHRAALLTIPNMGNFVM